MSDLNKALLLGLFLISMIIILLVGFGYLIHEECKPFDGGVHYYNEP